MRAGEIDGETYHFVEESRLLELRREGRVIEERTYDTVYGPWTYATVDEDIDLQKGSYIAIGTLESFVKLRDYYGTDRVVPLYIEVSDENLLLRAMKRTVRISRRRRSSKPGSTDALTTTGNCQTA